MRIILNAGHGAGKEHNRGGIYFNEGDNNYLYSLVLKEELEKYSREILRPNNLNVPQEKQILSPAMIFAFLEYLPTDHEEFKNLIPSHLRKNIDPIEGGEHLVKILEIINQYA